MKENARVAYRVGSQYICSKLMEGEIKFKNIMLIFKCKFEENNNNNNSYYLHNIYYVLGTVP